MKKMNIKAMKVGRKDGSLTLGQRRRLGQIVESQRRAAEKVRRLRFPTMAEEFVERYNLNGTRNGKKLLSHELQSGLLKNLERRTRNEEKFLSLLENALTIEHTLWQAPKEIAWMDAIKVYKAALTISLVAANNNSRGKWGNIILDLETKIREINRELTKSSDGTTSVKETSLLAIASTVDLLQKQVLPKKGGIVRKGLNEIEGSVRWVFSKKKEQQG